MMVNERKVQNDLWNGKQDCKDKRQGAICQYDLE